MKILLIGSKLNLANLLSYEWHNLPPKLNIADFDVIILNYVPLYDKKYSESIDIVSLPKWEQFARFIFSQNGNLFIIGKTNIQIGNNPYLDGLWWLPFRPNIIDESGDTFDFIADHFKYYYKYVKKWDYCFKGWESTNTEFLNIFMEEAGLFNVKKFNYQTNIIARNRYSFYLSFMFSISLIDHTGKFLAKSSPITFLQSVTEISIDESILLILREEFGILKQEKRPLWLKDYFLPDEIKKIKKIDEIKNKINELNNILKRENKELNDIEYYKNLLFETGKDVLEPAVLKTLKLLGAIIKPVPEKGKEDGRIIDPFGREATIEIKGRSTSLRLKDVRQLHQWVSDRLLYEDKNTKGVLIANLFNHISPSKRKNLFPDNCIKAAQNFNLCLLSTTQLFKALILKQENKFNEKKFWDSIFNQKGVCNYEDL